jgi:hypothetical protein
VLRHRKCCSKHLSPLTLAYAHSVLKSALEHAVRQEEVPRNVRMGTPRLRRFEPFTTQEACAFLAATHGHRLHALFELALRTGLRKRELLGLCWEDLDLAGGSASIRRTLQRTNSGGLTALRTETQSLERRIALPTECLRSLEQHRYQHASTGPPTQSSLAGTNPVGLRPTRCQLSRAIVSPDGNDYPVLICQMGYLPHLLRSQVPHIPEQRGGFDNLLGIPATYWHWVHACQRGQDCDRNAEHGRKAVEKLSIEFLDATPYRPDGRS